MSTLVITRGIPASGKTTWARKWVAEDPANRMRINRDDIRAMVHTDYAGGDTEQATTLICHAAVRQALRKGKDVVCDDTNLNARFLKALLKMAEGAGADVQFKDFDIPVLNAIHRDAQRGYGRVGPDVIEKMAKRYLVDGRIPEPPTTTPPVVCEPYVPDANKPHAIIVDLDGTVAINGGHRSFYDYTKVYDDKVNWPIVHLVHELGDVFGQIFVSGRKDSCRDDTARWLLDKLQLAPERYQLFMRKDGDDRDDAIVKHEIFNAHIRDEYVIRYVLDDRNRVVEMWRKLGLTVLQVADGDF